MCGIAGVYALTDRPPDPEWGPLLAGALSHRGPDGEGVYSDPRVVLAHRRLAIIDLGEGGRQPMTSTDGRHVLVQNGEIYNYADLRESLVREGAALRSHSDTETMLEWLVRRGVPGLGDLRGMFAFGLYDRQTGELTVARDRLGKKPVVWVRTPEYFAFASEVQALLKLPFVRARLDRDTLRDYVQLLYVPSPHTLLEGVHKLPPASWLALAPGAPQAPPQRWWRLPAADLARRPDAEWLETLDREFLEATRLRTVSDVPIGVFLSGGVDSNAVLECLKRSGHRPIRTFTVGFEGLPDERGLARAGAAANADEHVELVVAGDLAREIPAILDRFGEPLGDSAVVNNALIAREAARHVKVILNGDGGDELFGGYPRYPFARRVDVASRWPLGSTVLRGLVGGRAHAAAVWTALVAGSPDAAARVLGSVTDAKEAQRLLRADVPEALHANGLPPRDGTLTGALFAWDTGVYLPDDLLVKVDVASMAYGLENRSPFLDHRLFEHLAALPASRRASPFETKPLLRRLVQGRIPPDVLRAPKRGFSLPLERWLRGPLHGWLTALLGEPQAMVSAFRDGALQERLRAFEAGRADGLAAYRLWGLAVLEHWARRFDVQVPA